MTARPLVDRRGSLVARLRMPLAYLGVALLLGSAFGPVPYALAVTVFILAFTVYLRLGTPRGRPVRLRPPVVGRWRARNSPADRIPSHGLHAYGQTYAIDLVHEPEGEGRPGVGWLRFSRPPEDHPAFGQAVLAPAGGTVARVHDAKRDHRTRSSWPALAVFLLESSVREAGGPGWILGNHVVIELDDGGWAVLAHLQQGSARVEPGQRVEAGALVARCGNTGNSTEPHVHLQVMDDPRLLLGAGVPICFDAFDMGDQRLTGVLPSAEQPFVARTAAA